MARSAGGKNGPALLGAPAFVCARACRRCEARSGGEGVRGAPARRQERRGPRGTARGALGRLALAGRPADGGHGTR